MAIYHASDRAAEEAGISAGNLQKRWKEKSRDFVIVDMVAHHFKHIKSKAPPCHTKFPLHRRIYFESRLACIFLLCWLITPSLAGLRSE